ncbi:uncharacterized protein BDZ99DRAFT_461713 [Mytilinidion resinicola]|uniref:Uncharacterized protein n=1 Tax=Mytilinidion resinicola TaxID=574789 RepID=A0A6A6YT70_9PEZI|nr:uncharacterized protein BDZ99DRAFT_461713 [Mytilinidion resinicola]KAF2811719.1 hypothetical protein BDZ99DRAFT_461713 [Mytilinidion resinicola]
MNILFSSSNGNSRRLSQRSLPPLPPSSQQASVTPIDSPVVASPTKYVDIPKWPKTAQGIEHAGVFTVFSRLGNVLTIVVACAFFTFGAFVFRHDRVPTSDVPHLGLLRDAARYVSSLLLYALLLHSVSTSSSFHEVCSSSDETPSRPP